MPSMHSSTAHSPAAQAATDSSNSGTTRPGARLTDSAFLLAPAQIRAAQQQCRSLLRCRCLHCTDSLCRGAGEGRTLLAEWTSCGGSGSESLLLLLLWSPHHYHHRHPLLTLCLNDCAHQSEHSGMGCKQAQNEEKTNVVAVFEVVVEAEVVVVVVVAEAVVLCSFKSLLVHNGSNNGNHRLCKSLSVCPPLVHY